MFAPLAIACCLSSSTRTPEPSPITNPSLAWSHGRELTDGLSLKLVLNALAAAKPDIPILQHAASAPPATITSASPYRIILEASPIACAPVEQAVTTEWLGPLKPYLILTCPDKRLINAEGIKKGLTFLGPFEIISSVVLAIVSSPPIPDPSITPVLCFSSSFFGFQPESSTACIADIIPYAINLSILF